MRSKWSWWGPEAPVPMADPATRQRERTVQRQVAARGVRDADEMRFETKGESP
jgi:hypothetical protein